MPQAGGASPQAYKGARIYVNSAKKGFRVIRDAKERFSERFVSWRGERPTSESWALALEAVDEYCKGKKGK